VIKSCYLSLCVCWMPVWDRTITIRSWRKKYETARKWVTIEYGSVGHRCKKFPAPQEKPNYHQRPDVTTSLLGLWSLQCAAMWLHVACKKFNDTSFSPLPYSLAPIIWRYLWTDNIRGRKMWTRERNSSGFWFQGDSKGLQATNTQRLGILFL